MQIRTILRRYHDEHVTYVTSDYPKVFAASRAHLERIWGSKNTSAIRSKDVREYLAERKKGHTDSRGRKWKAPTPATVRRELSTLLAAVAWGIKHKWLTANDVPVIDLPAASPVKDTWLTKDEAVRFIKEAYAIDWRIGLFVAIGLFTGARPNAIKYLAWHRVNMAKGIIDFRPHNERAESKKRYGRVRMMPELIPFLESAFRKRAGEGGYWVLGDTKDIRYKFRQAFKAAGIKKPITPNTMRHTWATWSAIDSVDLHMIARVLGSTLKTVEKRYAHHHPSYQEAATQRKFFGDGELTNVRRGGT